MSLPPRIELLAPAGDERALRAALAAGADAVYFGLERWSARAFAGNFAGEAAVRAIELAHRFDAHAYLALNTLFRDDEIGPALKALEAPYRAGLDGLIVADLGFAALVRDLYADLPLHASTQLNTHSSTQLDALGRLGFARAILARELSLAEIAALDAHGLELEAFVHGALCYGYSGDCLLASMVGGRSGNRGRCSQSCRLRYRLSRADGPPGSPMPGAGGRMEERGTPRGGASRVLSTADLCAIAALPDLIAAGVTSFKVEGRMKDPAYVAVTTAVYREALDTAVVDPDGYAVRPEWTARLEQSFSRGFTTAHLDGRHHEVRSGGRGGHRGVLVGRVERVQDESGAVVVRLAKPVAAGDVVYLYTSQGQTEPVRLDDGAGESLTLCVRERVSVKDRLFRLAAAGVDEFARDAVAGRYLARPIGLSMRLEGGEGDPATLTVRLARAARDLPGSRGGSPPDVAAVGLSTPGALVVARTAALTETKARDALGALGGTPYGLEELQFAVADGLFLSVAELKDLRRRAVATLDERRLAARRRDLPGARPHAAGARASDAGPARLAGGPARPARRDDAAHGAVGPEDAAGAEVAADRRSVTGGVGPGPSVPRLAVPVVMLLDVDDEPRPAPGVVELCLDLETTAPVRDVAATFARCAASGLPVRCRPPEVLFDCDLAWWREVAELPWDAVVVRHLGLLAELAQSAPFVLEYPLQGLNGLAAGVLAGLAGRSPAAVVASPEASLGEVAALAAQLRYLDPPPALEIVAFGRQQVLRTRDQLGRAEGLVEAPGPAEHVGLLLEDAKGYVVPGRVDADGTRLFNARVTNLAPNLMELLEASVAGFHVVRRDLSPEEGRAFASGGLPALALFAGRERSTKGHLFRGVA